jgi:hypothetical protein
MANSFRARRRATRQRYADAAKSAEDLTPIFFRAIFMPMTKKKQTRKMFVS